MSRLLMRARAALAAAILLAGAALAVATWIHGGAAAAERGSGEEVADGDADADADAAPHARDPPPAAGPEEEAASRPGASDPCRPRRGRVVRGQVNLNTATREQLMGLPGVGPSLAARILDWRERRGGFRRVRDLRRVRGFGPKTLEKLAPHLAIDGPTTLAVE